MPTTSKIPNRSGQYLLVIVTGHYQKHCFVETLLNWCLNVNTYVFCYVFIDKEVNSTPVPLCDGKRCILGKCVPWENVCDGIPNCRDEQDETIKMCNARVNKCNTNSTLCSKYHILLLNDSDNCRKRQAITFLTRLCTNKKKP